MFTYLGVLPVWERVTLDMFSRPMALQSVSMDMLRPQPGRKGVASNNNTLGGGC